MPRRFSLAGVGQLSHRFFSTVFVFHLLPFGHYVCLVLKIFNFSVFPPYAMWLNVISINLMQLSKRVLFTEWKNVWFTRYQLCTGDKVATRVDPVLSKALEFVKQRWPQHVEDLRLQPFFNCQFELSVEQDCLLRWLRVINPTRLDW